MFGKTCIVNTHFENFASKCNDQDRVITSNNKNRDYIHQLKFVSGNTFSNVLETNKVKFYRPRVDLVNIAECGDMFCDAHKKVMITDNEGSFFGEPGTLLPESEYEWDGIRKKQPDGSTITYADNMDGIGNFRIPNPMQTTVSGQKIPMNEVYTTAGIYRDASCVWKYTIPAWWCPKGPSDLAYADLFYESLDEDHQRRRLGPIGEIDNIISIILNRINFTIYIQFTTKSKTFSIKLAYRTEGFLDLVNGPGDNSNCVGYSCFVRLSQFHSIVPCGKSVDYILSATTPLEMKFRLPDVQSTCKVKVNFYTKRPNRIDLLLDGAFKVRL